MEVNLSKEEIGVLLKCVDTAIMFYISHQWGAHPNEKRRLEGVLLNKLKEKFCKTLMKEEDNIKIGGVIQIEKKAGRMITMNKQSIEILNGILNYNEIHNNFDKRLVIIEPKEAIPGRGSKPGVFVSFNNLTSGDFFEIYRYKKSLERDKERREMINK